MGSFLRGGELSGQKRLCSHLLVIKKYKKRIYHRTDVIAELRVCACVFVCLCEYCVSIKIGTFLGHEDVVARPHDFKSLFGVRT